MRQHAPSHAERRAPTLRPDGGRLVRAVAGGVGETSEKVTDARNIWRRSLPRSPRHHHQQHRDIFHGSLPVDPNVTAHLLNSGPVASCLAALRRSHDNHPRSLLMSSGEKRLSPAPHVISAVLRKKPLPLIKVAISHLGPPFCPSQTVPMSLGLKKVQRAGNSRKPK